ncbi:PadR family transcriptional regulator [Nakamurella aerolata]|uniref:PadR family transcriptional regulator n=1 Tax=Nakamurella aerolata TaxID=1656892 RepID=A0A849ABH8_9ACTN|nr:PadR family transcriptional regulator [Nakamurella aerolata]NNG37033.1 PadR family transcriptional regulator [Nakamurella aerolata]
MTSFAAGQGIEWDVPGNVRRFLSELAADLGLDDGREPRGPRGPRGPEGKGRPRRPDGVRPETETHVKNDGAGEHEHRGPDASGPCRPGHRGRDRAPGGLPGLLGELFGGLGGGPHRRWGGGPFGGPPWGPRSRAGRGDVRSAVLALVAEQPMHGYQIIQEISRRSGGVWRPSPGSVYPTLQQLEDEGLVRAQEQDGRRVFHLTDDGRTLAGERADEFSRLWDGYADATGSSDEQDLGQLIAQVATAFVHVAKNGTPQELDAAREVLRRTRSDLYGILSGNPPEADAEAADQETPKDQKEQQ